LAAAQALSNRFTHAFIDERAHSSLRDAARHLSPQTRVQTFRHRNPSDLARRLHRAGPRSRPLVMTDGLFAFDGSLAPLREYLAILPASGRLLVDDAQAAGVLGKQGRGSPEHWRFTARERARVIHVIALSKAFGVGGAAVLGSPDLRHGILQNSPVFSGSTALSPPLAAAALAALQVARADPTRRTRLQEHIARVRAALHGSNQPAAAPSPSPIIALFPRDSRHAAALRKILVKAGIYPSFIHYPGGPSGGFFRLALSSEHRPRQISSLASALSACFPPARGRNSSRSIYTNNSPARGDR
jgi:7-keto-8-aminopelargonate synthetase-like enzyme